MSLSCRTSDSMSPMMPRSECGNKSLLETLKMGARPALQVAHIEADPWWRKCEKQQWLGVWGSHDYILFHGDATTSIFLS
jgi:hypothetical protein